MINLLEYVPEIYRFSSDERKLAWQGLRRCSRTRSTVETSDAKEETHRRQLALLTDVRRCFIQDSAIEDDKR